MNLLHLVEEMGLNPKRTSLRSGGEYHCPCPRCGGKDRFMFWVGTNRYWCRQCRAHGDAIQFCKDFQGLSFLEARAKAGELHPRVQPFTQSCPVLSLPSRPWQEAAEQFVSSAHDRLLIDPFAQSLLMARGLSLDTIKQHQLGWNPISTFPNREDWGLEHLTKEDKRRRLLLPMGTVIPTVKDGQILKIKIRRSDWRPNSCFGKYYVVPGSTDCMPRIGDPSSALVVIVEAELDAMLVVQEAGDLCACVALGGAQKRPDDTLHSWLQERENIFFALDYDPAGIAAYQWWQQMYPQLEPWPVPEEKSPGDYFEKGGDLWEWVSSGLNEVSICTH